METSRLLIEYCLNALWLVPVVGAAAWLLVKISGLRSAGEHRIWLAALVACLALPLAGTGSKTGSAPKTPMLKPLQVSAEAESANILPVTAYQPEERLNPASPSAPDPARRQWLAHHLRALSISPKFVQWFGWLYAGISALSTIRFVRVWWVALRLILEASPYALSEADQAMLQELAARLKVTVPRVVRSSGVAGPIVVGLLNPDLLLPDSFAQASDAERQAIFCHELAHLRRRDCLVHCLVRVSMIPLGWHPAVHLILGQIARTREMVCDEIAAEAMSPGVNELLYARCLVNLARRMVGKDGRAVESLGLGLFRTNKLEERVMRLTEMKRVLSVRETFVRRVGDAAVACAVLVAGAMVHVAPVVAQESLPPSPAAPLSPEVPVASEAVPALHVTAAPAVTSASTSHPTATSTPEPLPHPLPGPEAEALATESPVGVTSSLGDEPSAPHVLFEISPGTFQNDHGEHVIVKDGEDVHRFLGADGQQYEVHDAQSAPYTREQERAAEAEYKRRIAQAQAAIDKAQKELNSPEFKAQMNRLASDVSAEAVASAGDALAKAAAKFNSPKFKAQVAQWNSPEFKARMQAQMKALQGQMAHLNSEEFREQMAQFHSPEFAAKMAEAERQAARVNSPEMQQKMTDAARQMDAAAARLEAAAQAMAEAQKRLQETPGK